MNLNITTPFDFVPSYECSLWCRNAFEIHAFNENIELLFIPFIALICFFIPYIAINFEDFILEKLNINSMILDKITSTIYFFAIVLMVIWFIYLLWFK